MKTATQVKLDRDVKEKAQKLASEFGLSLSTLINAQLKQFIREKRLYLSTAPEMASYLEGILGPIERDLTTGTRISKPIRTPDELDSYFASL